MLHLRRSRSSDTSTKRGNTHLTNGFKRYETRLHKHESWRAFASWRPAISETVLLWEKEYWSYGSTWVLGIVSTSVGMLL
jgi:hypothetical protein